MNKREIIKRCNKLLEEIKRDRGAYFKFCSLCNERKVNLSFRGEPRDKISNWTTIAELKIIMEIMDIVFAYQETLGK